MGLFNKMFGKKKENDLEMALRYIQEEYPKQMANFERKLDQTSEMAAKRSAELDQKLSKIEGQIDNAFARIESAFENSRTFGNPTRFQQERQAQMQKVADQYCQNHPSTPQEDAEAEALLRQIMSQDNETRHR